MNKCGNFNSSKQPPYEFYFIDEPEFEEYCSTISKGEEKNISTLGIISEYDSVSAIGTLKYANLFLKINFARVANFFQWNKNFYTFLYGIVKKENDEKVIYVNFYRSVEDMDLENFISCNAKRREIITSCKIKKEENIFGFLL